jgi:hypothetical protein
MPDYTPQKDSEVAPWSEFEPQGSQTLRLLLYSFHNGSACHTAGNPIALMSIAGRLWRHLLPIMRQLAVPESKGLKYG